MARIRLRKPRLGRRERVALAVLAFLGAGAVMASVVPAPGTDFHASQVGFDAGKNQLTSSDPATLIANVQDFLQQGAAPSPSALAPIARTATTPPPSGTRTDGLDRLVIFMARIQLEVKDVPEAVRDAEFVAVKHGGFVSDSNLIPGGDNRFSAEITLRIPADKFSAAITELRELGTLRTLSTTSRDVTDIHVDLAARLTSARKLLAQYQQFLAQTTNVRDALEVQARIDEIQLRIEQLTAQLALLDKQVSLATISLSLRQLAEPPEKPTTDLLAEALAFAQALAQGEVRGLALLTIGLAPLWVWLVPVALLIRTLVVHRRANGSA